MEKTTIYGVEDHYASNSKYGELILITTWLDNLPKTFDTKKYIDTKKSYRYTYYFSTLEKAMEFENELFLRYNKE